MNIAICDDERVFAEQICTRIKQSAKKYGSECDVHIYDCGEALVSDCKKDKYDAVFLDIAMPKYNGFEIAKKLTKLYPDINLVFVSGKETMVYSSYEYSPIWFVPKSQLDYIDTAVYKILKKIENTELESKNISIVVEKNKALEIDLKSVSYIKSDAHYLKIYSLKNEPSESYRNNMDNLEKQLSKFYFVRCHERYLVNIRVISSIEKCECVLINGERIPISRSKMANTKSHFQQYLRGIV